MTFQKINQVEKKVNELLELYDISLSNGEYDKSIDYLTLIENELDLLDKNEIQVSTLLH
jgi:hypothetical protein